MTEHVIGGGLDLSMSSLVTNKLSLTTVVNVIVIKFDLILKVYTTFL